VGPERPPHVTRDAPIVTCGHVNYRRPIESQAHGYIDQDDSAGSSAVRLLVQLY
jgi:hypothetical protein